MDIFKFVNPTHPLMMVGGELLNGITKVEWTERYLQPDDFKITAPYYTNLLRKAPIGCFLSHINSDTVMVVENHEMNKASGSGTVTISGRSIETIFEKRPTGAVHHSIDLGADNVPPDDYMVEHETFRTVGIATGKSYDLAVQILRNVALPGFSNDVNDRLSAYPTTYLSAGHTSSEWSVPISDEMDSTEGQVLENVHDVLMRDNFGLHIERPLRGYYHDYSGITWMVITPGQGRSTVIFDDQYGDLETADLLRSTKNLYNTIYLRGTNVAYMKKDSDITGLDRRIYFEEYTEADSEYEFGGGVWQDPDDLGTPSSVIENIVMSRFKNRASELLGEFKETDVLSVEITKNLNRFKYRKDYKVGDVVFVNFGFDNDESLIFENRTAQRVIEYVEIEDENGYTGYPVLENVSSQTPWWNSAT